MHVLRPAPLLRTQVPVTYYVFDAGSPLQVEDLLVVRAWKCQNQFSIRVGHLEVM